MAVGASSVPSAVSGALGSLQQLTWPPLGAVLSGNVFGLDVFVEF